MPALYLKDITGNHNDLSVATGTVVADTSATAFAASQVDADYSTSSSLTAPDSTSLALTGNQTIELWLKQKGTGVSNDRELFSKGFSGTNKQWKCYIQSNDTFVVQTSNDGTASKTGVSSATHTSTSWAHIALVYTIAAGTVRIVRDGSDLETLSSLDTTLFNSTADLRVGSTSANWGMYVDDYRIWTTALSTATINANKSTHMTGSEANLVAYFPMEELIYNPEVWKPNKHTIEFYKGFRARGY